MIIETLQEEHEALKEEYDFAVKEKGKLQNFIGNLEISHDGEIVSITPDSAGSGRGRRMSSALETEDELSKCSLRLREVEGLNEHFLEKLSDQDDLIQAEKERRRESDALNVRMRIQLDEAEQNLVKVKLELGKMRTKSLVLGVNVSGNGNGVAAANKSSIIEKGKVKEKETVKEREKGKDVVTVLNPSRNSSKNSSRRNSKDMSVVALDDEDDMFFQQIDYEQKEQKSSHDAHISNLEDFWLTGRKKGAKIGLS
tara:strand:- start:1165 stop:1929 length:765 start_codon:yes stop_codon:yes gene_type:complete